MTLTDDEVISPVEEDPAPVVDTTGVTHASLSTAR